MKNFLTPSSLGKDRRPHDFSKVGKVTAESVLKYTGKDWEQWIGILEKAGARAWKYAEIVAYLRKKHRLTPWWQQGVALGFEIATGRRLEGQDAKGKYMVTTTKTFPCDVRDVWSFLVSPEGQELWLKPIGVLKIQPRAQFETKDGFFGEVRTMAAHRRVRLYWQDPLWSKHTVVELMLVPKPKKKCILVFNHTGIAEAKHRDSLRARWKSVVDEIADSLRT